MIDRFNLKDTKRDFYILPPVASRYYNPAVRPGDEGQGIVVVFNIYSIYYITFNMLVMATAISSRKMWFGKFYP